MLVDFTDIFQFCFLELGQPYDLPDSSVVVLKNMGT